MADALWVVLAVLAAAGMGTCLYQMYRPRGGFSALRAFDPAFQSLDMRFHYRADDAYACFERVGEEGRAMLARLWGVDFAFILCLLAAMLLIGRGNVRLVPLRYAMHGAALLRALLDALENALLLSACRAFPKRRDALATGAGFVTTAKWLAMGLWLAGLFGSLFFAAATI